MLAMLFSVSATALAVEPDGDSDSGEAESPIVQDEDSIEIDPNNEAEQPVVHGKKGKNLKKTFRKELNERKRELQQLKSAISKEKEQLEAQYEELLASGDTEGANALLEEIENLKLQIDAKKAEVKKAINERFMLAKTLYFDEELAQVNSAAELIAQMYKDAATLDTGSVSVKNNLIKFDVPPYIKGVVTLIPVRAITEQLGCDVTWDGETRTVTVSKNNIEIKITIGSRTVYVNGSPVELNTAAEITCGRTFLPLRFIAEAMGLEVSWDGDNQVIDIDDPAEEPVDEEVPDSTETVPA